jgi:hypothetical protein
VATSNRSSGRPRRAATRQPKQSQRRTRTTARVIRAGEVATALAAIVGLLFLVGDRLPWGDAAPAPRVLRVSVGNITIDEPVRYGSFLRTIDGRESYEAGARARGIPPPVVQAQLNTPGVEVAFDLKIDGPPGRQLELTPRVYKAHGRIAADMPAIAPVQTEHFRSEAWNELGPSSTWVSYPAARGEYYIELRVDELKGDRRDFVVRKRTDTFRVLAR